MQNLLAQHGLLLVAKYISGFAAVAPPLAGAMGLSLTRFILFSAAGALQ